jgi:p-aminobenzoyl-glutamate transporter AbgT
MASQGTAVGSRDSWVGWIVFAGFVLLMIGSIDAFQGLVAIIRDEYVIATPKGIAIFDVTTWGWLTLLWGFVLIVAGLALLAGSGFARWLAIIAVFVNTIEQIGFMANYPQAYPLWNILIITLNILVLYALTAHWRGFKDSLAT